MLIPKHIFYQIFATVTAYQAFTLTGPWLAWPSIALPKLWAGEIPIAVTKEDITWVVALTDIGLLLSPIPASYIMDKHGRVVATRFSALIFILAALLVLTAKSLFQLCSARLIAGLGMGICYTAVPAYVAEIALPEFRGAMTGFFAFFSSLGIASTMTFGSFISFDAFHWILLLLPVIQLSLSYFLPESPYFFYMRGDETAAKDSFNKFRDKKSEIANEKELVGIKEKIEEDRQRKSTWSSLVSRKSNRKAAAIMGVLLALQRLGGINSIIAYSSTILPVSDFWHPKVTNIIFGWAFLIAAVISSLLIDRFGRKPLLLVSATFMGMTQAVTTIFFYFYQKTETDVSNFLFIPHVGSVLSAFFICLGVVQIPYIYQNELFPTSVRSQASAVCTIFSALCSFTVNKVYLSVENLVGLYAMHLEFCIINFLGVIFTVFYVFETKGKTLSEIQDILNK